MHSSTLAGLCLVLSFLLFSSCNKSPYEKTDLLGNWTVVNWEIEKTGQKRSNQMDMSFQEDDRYEVDYGSEKELGKFWIANSYLHTQEDNQAAKKVKILTLTIDTFHMQMNRGGVLENVLLIKK